MTKEVIKVKVMRSKKRQDKTQEKQNLSIDKISGDEAVDPGTG
jgi:hypothetical protein